MVGPIDDAERLSFMKRLKVGFVLLVGVSAGLITLQTDAGPTAFAGALAVGSLLGIVLVRFAFPAGGSGDGADSWERRGRR
jgi:lysozyme family protein